MTNLELEILIKRLKNKIICVGKDVHNLLSQDILDALNNSDNPSILNVFATMQDLSNIGVGTNIFLANNYSALPLANLHNGEFYWVENSQGTYWLPGSLGGTYYPKGLYYSNGTHWTYTDAPYQATQAEVDAGINNTKFVTPQTFFNSSKWSTGNLFQDTFSNGTSFNYNFTQIGFSIKGCKFFTPLGDEVSIKYNISDKLYIDSNINLLNHKIIIY